MQRVRWRHVSLVFQGAMNSLNPVMRIGAQIDPGVPWCHAATGSGRAVHLALKSGNFGTTDFFDKAFEVLA